MPRKGQRLKTVRPRAIKPRGASKRAADPLAHNPMLPYLDAHCAAAAALGVSPATLRARRVAARRFLVWCEARAVTSLEAVTRPIVERFQRHLFQHRKSDGRPMTLGSQHACLAALKAWFRWLARENHIRHNPTADLQLPRLPRRLPRVLLSVAEVEAIIAEADQSTPGGLRDRALLETLYSTGLRARVSPPTAPPRRMRKRCSSPTTVSRSLPSSSPPR